MIESDNKLMSHEIPNVLVGFVVGKNGTWISDRIGSVLINQPPQRSSPPDSSS